MNELKIIWDQEKREWCVYDQAGNDLWCGEKYADAASFAEDYVREQTEAAKTLSTNISTAAVRD